MRVAEPRVLAISPPVPGPWLDQLPVLVDAGVDALLVRVFGDVATVRAAVLRARAAVPVVLLRWQRPGDEALAAALGVGLHLPASQPRVRPPGLALCSTSCHSRAEVAAAAAAGFPMVTLSPIFSPGSKPDDTRPPLGLAALGGLPPAVAVLALGGMTAPRAVAAVAAGAHGVAGIGAFFRGGQVHEAGAAAVAAAVRGAQRES